jgi:hypothetical protein
MNENLKKVSKEILVITLAVITFVGFGMPSVMYLNSSSGSDSSSAYAAVAAGGENITKIADQGDDSVSNDVITTDSGDTTYDAGMTFMYNGNEVSYNRVLKIVAGSSYGKESHGPFGDSAAKFVKVYNQYFAPTKDNMFGSSNNKGGTAKFRIGYYITNGGVDGDLSKVSTDLTGSTLSLGSDVVGGTTSTSGQTTTVNGLKVNSYSDNLNPIVVQGTDSSKTTVAKINDATINLLGKSDGNGTVCDFSAWGSGISVFDDAKVYINKADIHTTGVARCAVEGDDGSDTYITNSSLRVDGGTTYSGYENTANTEVMVEPPWVLGITGNARCTNLLGTASTMTVRNTDAYAAKWGVLSTDGCSNVVLNTINSTVNMDTSGNNLTQDSGYGTYAIGNAVENFYGTTFNVATYGTICANGTNTLNYASSKGDIKTYKYNTTTKKYELLRTYKDSTIKDQKTTVNSEQFGVDIWGGANINVKDGTTFNTGNAAFLVKSGQASVNISGNSKINSKNGVIYQIIDNEDSVAVDPEGEGMTFARKYYSEKKGWEGINGDLFSKTATTGNTKSNLNISNSTLKGNIYNGSGYQSKAEDLTVNLKSGAALTGKISSTTIKHSTDGGKTQNRYIPQSKYYQFGHVVNKAYYNKSNNVTVSMSKNSTWKVTGTSIITKLTVAKGASLKGNVYMNGKKITVKAGKTYSGVITVKAL